MRKLIDQKTIINDISAGFSNDLKREVDIGIDFDANDPNWKVVLTGKCKDCGNSCNRIGFGHADLESNQKKDFLSVGSGEYPTICFSIVFGVLVSIISV